MTDISLLGKMMGQQSPYLQWGGFGSSHAEGGEVGQALRRIQLGNSIYVCCPLDRAWWAEEISGDAI